MAGWLYDSIKVELLTLVAIEMVRGTDAALPAGLMLVNAESDTHDLTSHADTPIAVAGEASNMAKNAPDTVETARPIDGKFVAVAEDNSGWLYNTTSMLVVMPVAIDTVI